MSSWSSPAVTAHGVYLARTLSSRGIDVREAATVNGALQAFREQIPDLLLLDINVADQPG